MCISIKLYAYSVNSRTHTHTHKVTGKISEHNGTHHLFMRITVVHRFEYPGENRDMKLKRIEGKTQFNCVALLPLSLSLSLSSHFILYIYLIAFTIHTHSLYTLFCYFSSLARSGLDVCSIHVHSTRRTLINFQVLLRNFAGNLPLELFYAIVKAIVIFICCYCILCVSQFVWRSCFFVVVVVGSYYSAFENKKQCDIAVCFVCERINLSFTVMMRLLCLLSSSSFSSLSPW